MSDFERIKTALKTGENLDVYVGVYEHYIYSDDEEYATGETLKCYIIFNTIQHKKELLQILNNDNLYVFGSLILMICGLDMTYRVECSEYYPEIDYVSDNSVKWYADNTFIATSQYATYLMTRDSYTMKNKEEEFDKYIFKIYSTGKPDEVKYYEPKYKLGYGKYENIKKSDKNY